MNCGVAAVCCWTRGDDGATQTLDHPGAVDRSSLCSPHPLADRCNRPVERRALQRGQELPAQPGDSLVDASPGHPPTFLLHVALGLGTADRAEPDQPPVVLLAGLPGWWWRDGGPDPGPGAGQSAGVAAGLTAGLLQPLPGALRHRRQELRPAGAAGGSGLVVATAAAPDVLWGQRCSGGAHPFLWAVSAAGDRGLGWLAPPSPTGVGRSAGGAAGFGLDCLCR